MQVDTSYMLTYLMQSKIYITCRVKVIDYSHGKGSGDISLNDCRWGGPCTRQQAPSLPRSVKASSSYQRALTACETLHEIMSRRRILSPDSSICVFCLRQRSQQLGSRRFYSGGSTSSGTPAPPLSGAARLPTRRFISLHGADAPRFLQGIITNNVGLDSTPQAGFFAAFLTAQGKVLDDVFIYPTLGSEWHRQHFGDGDPGFLVEVDADDSESLFKHIKRHKLRAKVSLRLAEADELQVWSVWKGEERWTPHTKTKADCGLLLLTDARAPGMGQRLLMPAASSLQDLTNRVPELEQMREVPISAYTIRRYLRGVAEGQAEIPREQTLPMNSNLDIMGGIDFKKGCYIGQELTIRTYHTGVVRRRILPVALYAATAAAPDKLEYVAEARIEMPEKGAEIMKNDQRRRATGRLIASVGNVGLGMCRLEQMSDLTVSGEGRTFQPEDTFIAQSAHGQDIGVKAFVPDWMRGRIREPKVQKKVE